MKKIRFESFALVALLGMGALALPAQEVVHAMAGTVTAVNPGANLLTLTTFDGSVVDFRYQKDHKTDLEFDKSIREGTIDPASFNKTGDHVLLYYFGEGVQSTAVALKDFGATALNVASGTVVKIGHHSVTVKTDSGNEVFDIAKDASAETPEGVVSGSKFDGDEGSKVVIRYTEANGRKTAEFIRPGGL